jgi:hypothetical protein
MHSLLISLLIMNSYVTAILPQENKNVTPKFQLTLSCRYIIKTYQLSLFK